MAKQRRIEEVSDDLSAAINDATLGRRDWSDVCAYLTTAFPGAYAAILNQNFVRPEVNFAVSSGIEESHFRSFLTHYSYVNPWRKFWEHAKSGSIIVSERDAPARNYADTAFYNEWMRAVGDFDAAIGLRLRVDDEQIIYVPVHFSEKLANSYTPLLDVVMQGIRHSLTNSLQIASYMREPLEKAAAKSALIDRGNVIACVVDDGMLLLEANQKAVDTFSTGYPVRCRLGRVRFAKPSIDVSLMAAIRTRPRDLTGKFVMTTGNDQWLITINQLPRAAIVSLVKGQKQFLLQAHRLAPQKGKVDGDLLFEAYKLTPSEIQLCRALAGGLLLAEAVKFNGISYENGRQKLKSIFKKTGVSSQMDLNSLLRLLC